MTSVDQIIIKWFNTDFGTGFSGGIVGNLVLVVLSLLMAGLLSGVLGYEREYHGHSAGLRTHILVALGSALVMIISIYGFSYWDSLYVDTTTPITRDPARLAAQVVTGIGFLGAGTIVQTGTDVKGLTTATTIWMCMAIGLACGAGSFVVAIAATIIAIFALITMRKVEKLAAKNNPIVMIVCRSDKPILKDVILIANRYNISIRNSQSELVSYQENSALRLTFHCNFASPSSLTAFVDELRFTIRPLELKVSTADN
ncbi:MAG: MgtC/SapB family protein [Bacilli bacterium]|jgi:putative Mg2+ transporter-C (MgtC) family protein|nr:MgtC/SapB family protein [Bacilli bacterium]